VAVSRGARRFFSVSVGGPRATHAGATMQTGRRFSGVDDTGLTIYPRGVYSTRTYLLKVCAKCVGLAAKGERRMGVSGFDTRRLASWVA
jgi:hypothetical protein